MAAEDKVTLSHRRAKLITHLTEILSTEDRVRIQGELSIINAKIKALNTTQAAELKAVADQRKTAGLAEAQANAARTRTKAPGSLSGLSLKTMAETLTSAEHPTNGTDQTDTIGAWIDAVLLRHDIDFSWSCDNKLLLSLPPKWAGALETLVAGLYAMAHGHVLPELPNGTSRPKMRKPKKH